MIIIKAWYHICAAFSKLIYKLIYNDKVQFGKRVTWRKNFALMIADEGFVKIGKNVFFNNYCSVNSIAGISIGDNSIFGENVKIYDHNHKFASGVPIKIQGFSSDKVTIGNNCWICSNVVILKGTHIGDHCVIGAGCVVSGDIPDNTIVKCNNGLIFEKIHIKDENNA